MARTIKRYGGVFMRAHTSHAIGCCCPPTICEGDPCAAIIGVTNFDYDYSGVTSCLLIAGILQPPVTITGPTTGISIVGGLNTSTGLIGSSDELTEDINAVMGCIPGTYPTCAGSFTFSLYGATSGYIYFSVTTGGPIAVGTPIANATPCGGGLPYVRIEGGTITLRL